MKIQTLLKDLKLKFINQSQADFFLSIHIRVSMVFLEGMKKEHRQKNVL